VPKIWGESHERMQGDQRIPHLQYAVADSIQLMSAQLRGNRYTLTRYAVGIYNVRLSGFLTSDTTGQVLGVYQYLAG